MTFINYYIAMRNQFLIFLFHFFIFVFLFSISSLFAKKITNITLEIKKVGGEYIKIPCDETFSVPLVAGDTYILRIKADSLQSIVARFPSLEEKVKIYSPKVFETDVSIPKHTARGTSYFINVINKGENPIIINFEVVVRGKVEMIRYKNADVPKRLQNIDLVKVNSTYNLSFEGDGMAYANLSVPRFPMLISGTFITLYSQEIGYEDKSMMLKIRIGKAEKELTTSLLYFINKMGIRDKNADIDVPWVRYTIGSGEVFKPQLPVDTKEGLTDLTVMQIE